MTVRILTGDCRELLPTLGEGSVQCVVTSPPYFGLRAYGTEPQVWGGDPSCCHEWQSGTTRASQPQRDSPGGFHNSTSRGEQANTSGKAFTTTTGDTCSLCGSWRGELGQEPTVALFVAHLVAVFAAVKRVLRPDGCLFVNLSDSYSSGTSAGRKAPTTGVKNGQWERSGEIGDRRINDPGIPAKNLLLVPDRFRIAMQEDGWYVRSTMPWVKRNCMPESVTDRPVNAVEDVILFTKQKSYYWDAEAVRRGAVKGSANAGNRNWRPVEVGNQRLAEGQTEQDQSAGRNFRTSDLFFDSLCPILDDAEPEPEPQPKPRKTDKQGDSGLRRYAGFNDRWDASGNGDANAGPPFPPQGLILDEAGDPLALDVNPEPFRGAHFATFPPKLVRPLILAGTSEKGCCAECGAPWVRQVEKEGITPRQRGYVVGFNGYAAANPDNPQGLHHAGHRGDHMRTSKTTGWSPSCRCGTTDTRPCLVLDCFAGAGTTGLVADQLGRDAVLIDLQPTYVAMGASRITGDAPLFASVEVTR